MQSLQTHVIHFFNKQQLLFVCLFVIFSLHFGALHSLFIQYYSGILGMIRT